MRVLCPLLGLVMVAMIVGCVVTTDDNLWKDGQATIDSTPKDLGLDATGEAVADVAMDAYVDGEVVDADGLMDGPVADLPIVDFPIPDLPTHEGKSPLGTPCATANQCQSNHCVNNVCCDTACAGLCMSCGVAGKEGTCSPVPADTDPDNECAKDPVDTCKQDGFCDGQGACQSYAVGTTCGSSVCTSSSAYAEEQCDSSGQCTAGSSNPCSKYACNPTTGACYTKCTTDAECQVGFNCIPSGKCK